MSISRLELARERLLAPVRRGLLRWVGVRLGRGVEIVGNPIIDKVGRGSILIGDRSVLISRSRWTALGVGRPVILRTLLPGATIRIGSDVGMSGTAICAARGVTIGDRVLIGADVMVADTDFHPVNEIPRRGLPIPEPMAGDEVAIGDDAFLGARSIVLKGSSIGIGAVVGAGSVVVGDVPAGAVVAGAPARFIRWVHDQGAAPEGD